MYKWYAVFTIIGIVIGIGLVCLANRLEELDRDNVVVRFAVEFNVHSAAFWIALDKGWFEEKGIMVDYKVFSTGLELATAMAKGDVDVAIACLGPLLTIKSRGYPVKLVAMVHIHGYAIVARKDIENIKDLMDKTVSSSAPGTPTWLLLELVKERYNVSFRIIRMPPYIALNALVNGKIDAASLPEHYATLAQYLGYKVVVRSQEIWSYMPGSGIAVSEEFLLKHRDIVEEIVEIIKRAVEYINKNPDKAAEIVAKHLATSPNIIRDSMYNLKYTILINKTEVLKYINYMYSYKILSKKIDLDEFIYEILKGDQYTSK